MAANLRRSPPPVLGQFVLATVFSGSECATFGFNSSTQISVQRNSTQDAGSFGWQVVEWGL